MKRLIIKHTISNYIKREDKKIQLHNREEVQTVPHRKTSPVWDPTKPKQAYIQPN